MENGAPYKNKRSIFHDIFKYNLYFKGDKRCYYRVKGLATGGYFGFIKIQVKFFSNKIKSKGFLASSLSK